MLKLRPIERRGSQLLVGAIVALALSGCGVSANPFRIGNLPAGDIKRTHAKPPMFGYYGNFDPKAHVLTVTPTESINPVKKQHILVATVCNDKGEGLRNRRVEWHVSGAGHIVEVDESGFFPGRGYMVDDKYAVSYTNYRPHVITRGNDDPSDDVHLKPGQTWCVITSAEEGETQVTCYAPGIQDWEKHKVFAVKHWIDAVACLPPPAVNAAGQPHTFTTRVTRSSDRTPVAGYRVRYRLLDGPAAVFEPGGMPQVEVASDSMGNASVVMRQLSPVMGVNRVAVEVIRPAEKVGGREFILAAGETSKTWVAPQLSIAKTAPPATVVGQAIPYQITVVNTGAVATRGVTVRDTIPETLQLIGAQPPATQQGANLLWRIPSLLPQQTAVVQFSLMPTQPGTVRNIAEARMDEGPAANAEAVTQVLVAALSVSKTGPASAMVGQMVTFQVTVTNNGSGPAADVVLRDEFDPGFAHASGGGPLQLPVGVLQPGEGRTVPITLQAKVAGRLCNRVVAVAAGGVNSRPAEHCVEVTQPRLSLTKNGPPFAYVGAPVSFELVVRNTGTIPATNVVIRDQATAELVPQAAPDGGLVQGSQVTWNLGSMAPGEQRTLRLLAAAVSPSARACNSAVLTADGGVTVTAESCLEIKGVPAIGTEMIDRYDPVPIAGETTYTIRVVNQGSMAANDVTLVCRLPEGLDFVDAEGATPHQYDARTRRVMFAPFSGMAPKKQLLYQVQARAIRPGDWRFEAQIKARELKEPVVIQESTRVYNPATGDAGGAMKEDKSGANVTVGKTLPAAASPASSTDGVDRKVGAESPKPTSVIPSTTGAPSRGGSSPDKEEPLVLPNPPIPPSGDDKPDIKSKEAPPLPAKVAFDSR